jgi:hypothetical protein
MPMRSQASITSSQQFVSFCADLLRYERHILNPLRRRTRNVDKSRQRRAYMFDSALIRHGLEQGLLGSAKMLDERPVQTLKGDSLPEYCPEDFNGSLSSNP